MTRRVYLLPLLLLVLALALLTAACGQQESTTTTAQAVVTTAAAPTTTVAPTTTAAPTTTESSVPETVTVTDAGGRTVTLSSDVKGIVTQYGLQYVLALGLGDKVLNGARTQFDTMVAPALKDQPSIVSSGNISVEAIAAMEPDVFIHKVNAGDLYDSLEKLGIPCIGIRMETVDEIVSTIDLLGRALGVEERAKELEAYYVSLMDKAEEAVSSVGQGERPTAILMGSTLGQVAHGEMLQSVMMHTAGGINMAADIKAEGTWPVAGVERILDWNPDFIFIQNSVNAQYSVEDLQKDATWAQLEAVKNNRTYVVPSTLDSWEFPGVGTAIGTLWMASIMCPELYTAEELEKDVIDFYQFVYGVTIDRATLGF